MSASRRPPTAVTSSSPGPKSLVAPTSRSCRHHLRSPAVVLVALLVLFLAAAAGVAFSVLDVVLHLHEDARSNPSRLVVFAASIVSVTYVGLHGAAARTHFTSVSSRDGSSRLARWLYGGRSSTVLVASALLLARLILVAWIAAVVLTSLLIAQVIGLSLTATVPDQAIYLNLIIGVVSLTAASTLCFCIETSRTPFKTALFSRRSFLRAEAANDAGDATGKDGNDEGQDEDEDVDEDLDDEDAIASALQRDAAISKTVRTSVTEEAAESAEAPAEARPKKLLFSYKATTVLVDDKTKLQPSADRVDQSERSRHFNEEADAEPADGETSPFESPRLASASNVSARTAKTTSVAPVKRKPIQPAQAPAPPVSRANRRMSMAPISASAMFTNPFEDSSSSSSSSHSTAPSAPPYRIHKRDSRMITTRASSASRSRPKMTARSQLVVDNDTFYLSSSDSSSETSSNSWDSSSDTSRSDTSRSDGTSHSDDRNGSSDSVNSLVRTARGLPRSPAVTRPLSIIPPVPSVPRPPVRPASPQAPPAAAASTKSGEQRKSGVVKRKPVGGNGGGGGSSPVKRKPIPKTTAAPASAAAAAVAPAPASPRMTLLLPPLSPLLSPLAEDTVLFRASLWSDVSPPASPITQVPSLSVPSLPTTMPPATSSTLGRSLADMVFSLRDSTFDLSAGFAPPTTRSVAFSTPLVTEPPVVRKSFVASTGSGSRRPSAVSVMETIYSPGGDEEAAEAAAEAEQAADMARRASLSTQPEPVTRHRTSASTSSSTPLAPASQPNRSERKSSLRHISFLSPVAEQAQEQDEAEAESSRPVVSSPQKVGTAAPRNKRNSVVSGSKVSPSATVHTIVVHEPATYAGVSRTVRRMRKAALKAMAGSAATNGSGSGGSAASLSPVSAYAYTPAYTRRWPATNYNFSRPLRAAAGGGSSSVGYASSLYHSGLPVGSGGADPRARMRRQLLQMLPAQYHQPPMRASLSGRRHRRSLSLDLPGLQDGGGDDDSSEDSDEGEWEDDDDYHGESKEADAHGSARTPAQRRPRHGSAGSAQRYAGLAGRRARGRARAVAELAAHTADFPNDVVDGAEPPAQLPCGDTDIIASHTVVMARANGQLPVDGAFPYRAKRITRNDPTRKGLFVGAACLGSSRTVTVVLTTTHSSAIPTRTTILDCAMAPTNVQALTGADQVVLPSKEDRNDGWTINFTTVDDLFKRLKEVSGDFLACKGVPADAFQRIEGKRNSGGYRLRFHYRADAEVLLIRIPTPRHEVSHAFLYRNILYDMFRMGLPLGSWSDAAATKYVCHSNPGYRGSAEADSSGYPVPRRGHNAWPTLVIKASCVQSLPSLRQMMRWWFAASRHGVGVVLLVKMAADRSEVHIEQYSEVWPLDTTGAPAQGGPVPVLQQCITIAPTASARPGCSRRRSKSSGPHRSRSTSRGSSGTATYEVHGGPLIIRFQSLFLRRPDESRGERDIEVPVDTLATLATKVWAES
ncbi:hypothetical protein SPI_03356 [Niveomyces insectorum RCEF 264]|uniref:Uncharacterized protein n=1 Tax=Niveomyces insectorum RCEF 264 TaxID=1081102 RepID=A0A167XA03_9HYPO|nr:hypothetical protein SPI_03356 [Niveomyces insectorum RCEF 264]